MAASRKLIQRNRRASFEYDLQERFEAGMVLTGTEVKSVREGKVSLKEAYARVTAGEVWAINLDIQPYRNAGQTNHEPKRPRKLLLSRQEIRRIKSKVMQKGLTLVPTQMYLLKGWVKLEIAIARGRARADKRHKIREREEGLRMRRRAMKR